MIEIIKIPKEKVVDVWLDIRENLEKPLLRSTSIERFPLDTILLSLLKGEREAWMIWDKEQNKMLASFVLEIGHYPTGKSLILFLLGGEGFPLWVKLGSEFLFEYAQEIGAKWIDTYSRRGFFKNSVFSDFFTEETTHYCHKP
jgi:hypothetical protein